MLSSAIGLTVAILAACCLCIVAWSIAKYLRSRRRLRQIGASGILASLSRVDIKALKHLIDPMEEAFLRQAHTRNEFCRLQKDRIEATLEYFRKMAKNARTLQSLGHRNLGSKNGTERILARRLMNRCVPVRMFAFTAISVLRIWKVLPIRRFLLVSPSLADLKDLAAELLPSYEELKEAAVALTMASEPEVGRKLLRNL